GHPGDRVLPGERHRRRALGPRQACPGLGRRGRGSARWGGITLAHNVASRDEVHAVIEEARGAGAEIAREPAETFYGGYAGVFRDPDAHAWEVAFNPGFGLREDGSVVLADTGT